MSTTRVTCDCHALTDCGGDDFNEDAVISLPEMGLVAVADGISGRPAGHRASQEALAGLVEAVRMLHSEWRRQPEELGACVQEANRRVRALANEDPLMAGAGTTLSAIVCVDDFAWGLHIGDSRIYLYEEGVLAQVSTDHSVEAELAELHGFDPKNRDRGRLRHHLTRAVGIEEQADCQVLPIPIRPGMWILLATDGLTAVLSDADISAVLRGCAQDPASVVCVRVLNAALEANPSDNLSVGALRVLTGSRSGCLINGGIADGFRGGGFAQEGR